LREREVPVAQRWQGEGPLGLAARAFCPARNWPFTTAYHARFPEYVHAPSRGVMVATETVRRELAAWGFEHLVAWTRGVDTALFRPGSEPAVALPRPVFLFVGRGAVEKNLPAFLDLDLPGSKLVAGVGDPARALSGACREV
jgi:hypothetical protein